MSSSWIISAGKLSMKCVRNIPHIIRINDVTVVACSCVPASRCM